MSTRSAAGRGLHLGRLRGENNEGILLLILIVLVIGMSLVNPAFFSASTLFAVIRTSLVSLTFALGVLMVIVSGGFDVSFPVVAIFSAYTTVVLSQALEVDFGTLAAFSIAAVIGALLGLINGLIIALFRLPTLIVTLGTQGIFWGFLLAFIGSTYNPDIPSGLANLSTLNILTVQGTRAAANLHFFVIPVVILCFLVAWVLRRTMYGRAIYAIGGDVESARRVGIPVVRTQVLIYVVMGVLAAVGGIMYITMARMANPYDLVGTELDVIAAVILGGAAVAGGRGSVSGTVIAVGLLSVIKSSLILMGVPGSWQKAAVGVLLLAGVTIQALSARRKRSGPSELMSQEVVPA